MSQPSEQERQVLDRVADELRDVVAERGYRVDVAMAVDPAFGSGWSRSAVTRDLVVAAVSGAASRVGLDFRPVNGMGREFRFLSGIVDRRYRLRRARRGPDGGLLITTSSDSALATSLENSLLNEEKWLFAWTLGPDGLIDEVLIAEVVGFTEGSPGYLKLGRLIALAGHDEPLGGFHPTDEHLDGFGEDEDFDEDLGFPAP